MDELFRYPRSTSPILDANLWFDRKPVICDAILGLLLTTGTCGIQGELNTMVFKKYAGIFAVDERTRFRQAARFRRSLSPERPYDNYYAKYTPAKTPGPPCEMPRFASFISHQIIARRRKAGNIHPRACRLEVDVLFEELESRARGGELEQLMSYGRLCTSTAFINMAKRGMDYPLRTARPITENVEDDDRERRLPYEVGMCEDMTYVIGSR